MKSSQVANQMAKLISFTPKFIVGFLVLFAISVMLCGVFLRYVMLPITDWMDVDPVNFFWVEEVGELALTWLVMIGAALGVTENSHFYLTVFTHKLSAAAQRRMAILNQLIIASFGALIAWICFKLFTLNSGLTSPALEISLGLFYVSATFGGILMALQAGGNIRRLHTGEQPNTAGGH